jgi:hypothetical protein
MIILVFFFYAQILIVKRRGLFGMDWVKKHEERFFVFDITFALFFIAIL